jgi:hypothetical protein
VSKNKPKNPRKPTDLVPAAVVGQYEAVLGGVVKLLESARHSAARTVNAFMTATYWEIGRRIVEFEQEGKEQAGYGAVLVSRLAADLTARFGRGFGKSNLYQMRSFYIAYRGIFQTPSGKFAATPHPASLVALCAAAQGRKG